MAISAEAMAKILNNSRKLMTSEAQIKINEAARTNGQSYDDYCSTDFLTESPQEVHYAEPVINSGKSKLPRAILESMTNNEIDCSSLDPNGMSSLMKKMEEQMPKTQPRREVVREERIIPTSSNGFDYGVLKQIIEECIDKKFREMNESTLKGVKLKDGKISLIDNGGNVFQATLEYKGKSKKQ